jgi:isopentenyl-diphosphate delta-isomerase
VDKTHRVVSSEAEQLILVDAEDRETGYLSKAEAHNGAGLLHRAFSVFLFNAAGELLLQQRSAAKRLWPGFWSNTCCSHPRRGESMAIATGRRLRDELDIETPLEFVYKFSYQAAFGDAGSERELCHVYLGKIETPLAANENEIAALRYVAVDTLAREFASMPGQFTPWFRMEWETLLRDHRDAVARYCDVAPV